MKIQSNPFGTPPNLDLSTDKPFRPVPKPIERTPRILPDHHPEGPFRWSIPAPAFRHESKMQNQIKTLSPETAWLLDRLKPVLESYPETRTLHETIQREVSSFLLQNPGPVKTHDVIRWTLRTLIRHAPRLMPVLKRWLKKIHPNLRLTSLPDVFYALFQWAQKTSGYEFLKPVADMLAVLRYLVGFFPSLLTDASTFLADFILTYATGSDAALLKELYRRALRGEYGAPAQGYGILLDLLLYGGKNTGRLQADRILFASLLKHLYPDPDEAMESPLLMFMNALKRSPLSLYRLYRNGLLNPLDVVPEETRNPHEYHRWFMLITRSLPAELDRWTRRIGPDGDGFQEFYALHHVIWMWLETLKMKYPVPPDEIRQQIEQTHDRLRQTFAMVWNRLREDARKQAMKFMEREYYRHQSILSINRSRIR